MNQKCMKRVRGDLHLEGSEGKIQSNALVGLPVGQAIAWANARLTRECDEVSSES